jgi:hypothetical protein
MNGKSQKPEIPATRLSNLFTLGYIYKIISILKGTSKHKHSNISIFKYFIRNRIWPSKINPDLSKNVQIWLILIGPNLKYVGQTWCGFPLPWFAVQYLLGSVMGKLLVN